MKWKLGDFVRFVEENREGYVTRIFDDQMIGVTGDDDFEIPVLASKVTAVHGHAAKGQAKAEDTNITGTVPAAFVKEGVFLAAIPDERAQSVVHFHLVNQTSFKLLAALTTQKDQVFKGEFSGIVEPTSSVKFYSAQLGDLQLWPNFDLEVIFYTPYNVKRPAAIRFEEKFKAKDFSGAKKQVPVLNKGGWLFRLDQPELKIDPEKLKESFFKPAEEKVSLERPNSEVDLHIEKLRNDYQFLGSSEILNIQLNHFRKSLDAAIVHQLPAIVFIHGAGNGILRHELHKQLSKHPKVQTFMDAQKEKFGYGATRVLLK
ncbi:Smr/MutS family protein [Mucilaginibacter sp. RS28]|uniref:Smr/MutS family protein n=1 Tax=Mucilaginibacter straminoryzae TaxID=2932774 RepID=A0A9X2B871_9SPHI|nr:Smr/MutS family protein [Mucilaginibacter straminoryzae]MCJ8209161.1 Smr/MutS family protein [Mucilaginibacter straminoryzae]